MSIYFCGSIRAGRADASIYKVIIDKLAAYGKVLTEHIGLDEPWNAPYLADFAKGQGAIVKDRKIFETDMNWLHSCDGLSALVRGAPSVKWQVVEYKDASELDEHFVSFFEKHLPKK
ncbi:Putative 2'-deoxynucleoside 5'-phosphate N-hydrolase 1 [Toxocara canis]|uniref:Putative 2'-deoxynucleoside 5'-phosphate N-hydrolase 1 n=1 Tax=Toxocara canis TaxID=6265 RepID=A0A0B2USY9_TOXCA|nr:Putative 2'-deoxynucleoside 5'-phosphate N-hydrolase 1 [Toxocara canis]